jgi:hypothetical protein
MNYSKAKKMFSTGDIVCIKNNGLKATNSAYTAVPEMHEMVGQTFTLSRMHQSDRHGGIACMSVGGFSWAAEDMYVVEHAQHGELVVDSGQKDILMFDPAKI